MKHSLPRLRWATLLTATLGLTACAPTLVRTYAGPELPASKVVVVRSESFEFGGQRYFAGFVSTTAVDATGPGATTKVGDAFLGYPRELHLAPGRHLLLVRCGTGNQYAFPSAAVAGQAGDEFVVTCGPIPDALSRVRVVVNKVEKTAKPQ